MILPRWLDTGIRKFLENRGYLYLPAGDLRALNRRRALMSSGGSGPVDLLLDVGANVGQYGKGMRQLGYRGRIVSFEPMRAAYNELAALAREDHGWQVNNFGLGEIEGTLELHISENSVSSSVLEMEPAHLAAAPRSRYIATEKISIRRLDDILPGIIREENCIWLKLDVQGFENRVLRGASIALDRVDFVQIELSFRPLYTEQSTYLEMCGYLAEKGLHLVGIEPGFTDPGSGKLLQADGIFARSRDSY